MTLRNFIENFEMLASEDMKKFGMLIIDDFFSNEYSWSETFFGSKLSDEEWQAIRKEFSDVLDFDISYEEVAAEESCSLDLSVTYLICNATIHANVVENSEDEEQIEKRQKVLARLSDLFDLLRNGISREEE